MAQKLSALPIGAKVKFGTIYGERIVWKVADKNHAGYPDNSVTLVTDQIIKCLCFDSPEPSSASEQRRAHGNHRYDLSNIRQWLNSEAAAGVWYTAQHNADNSPGDYNAAAGFLNAFSADERGALLDTTIKALKRSIDGSGFEFCIDKMFVLSNAEMGYGSENGSLVKLFENGSNVIATLTASAVSNHPNATEYNMVANKAYDYWTRDPYENYDGCLVFLVNEDGSIGYTFARVPVIGLRPACNLSADLLVADTIDSSGCYTLIYNRPPSTPEYINVPTQMYEGESATVSWSLSTDPDGNLEGYILEQKVNTNIWEQVYKGPDRIYTVPEMYGVSAVQYRVKAYDTNNAMSDYVTSPSITVISNRAPVIDGADGDLGVFVETPPHFTYVVSDADTDVVNVVEKFDGKVIKEYAATLDAQNAMTFDATAWLNVLNGAHTFEVVATDPDGGTAVRTVTFVKNVASIKFEKTVAVEASTMPTRALVNIQGNFPSGCELKVWLCNNGNDSSPTWEDATQNALLGGKFYFNNTVKTAGTWGVKIKVELNRGTATETCFIQSVGANFA